MQTFSQKSESSRHAVLSTNEIKEVWIRSLGYGKFKRTAMQLGLHPNTLRALLYRGYGTVKNVNNIRNKILGYESCSS